MLTVFVCDVAVRWASLPGVNKLAPVLAAIAVVFIGVAAGFYYWGLPYAYGIPLTSEQHRARMWHPKWN